MMNQGPYSTLNRAGGLQGGLKALAHKIQYLRLVKTLGFRIYMVYRLNLLGSEGLGFRVRIQ